MSIASVPNCDTGSWAQQWSCGLHANKTGAHVDMNPLTSHGGSHGAMVLVLIVAIVMLLIAAMLHSRGRKPATTR